MNGRRDRRVSVRFTVKIYVVPVQFPNLLGSGSSQQRDDDVSTERVTLGSAKNCFGLLEGKRLRWPAVEPLRNDTQLDNVAPPPEPWPF